MLYPSNCIKGIPNRSYVTSDGRDVGSNLFYFDLNEKFGRDDGFVEQSINWEDDDSAISFTLRQRRTDGEIQFQGGAAFVPRSEIDHLVNLPMVNGSLSYERQRQIDNDYHGNLLLRSNTPKSKMKQVAASLALVVSRIVPQPEA